ncbi:MAG: hypothetical protein KDD44_15175, partial [Bdellovibrionales bacterium]|nr:hypothetical protein [Bdellovibrionales bacterium]
NETSQLIDFFGFEEATKILREQKDELARLFAEIPADLSGDELALKLTEIAEKVLAPLRKMQDDIRATMEESQVIPNARSNIERQLLDQATGLVGFFGFDEANKELQKQKEELARLFDEIPANLSGDALALRISEISEQVLAPIRKMNEDIRTAMEESANLSDISSTDAIARIGEGLSALDNAALDGIPGLSAYRQELFDLLTTISESGVVTNEQAAQLEMLLGVTDAIGSSTSGYAEILNGLGFEFFNNNEQAGALFQRLLELDAAQKNGEISAENFAGQMGVLMSALYAVALAAGFTKEQLDSVFSAGNKVSTGLNSAYAGDPDFVKGQTQAQAFTDVQKIFAAERSRSQQR